MTGNALEERLEREVKGSLVRITRKIDVATGGYWLTAESNQEILHHRLHPDDPLPFSDGEWGTVLLEEVLGDVPDPHPLMREASRAARFRLLITQRLGEGRPPRRLQEIVARYFLLSATETVRLADGTERLLVVMPLEESAEVQLEFARRSGRA